MKSRPARSTPTQPHPTHLKNIGFLSILYFKTHEISFLLWTILIEDFRTKIVTLQEKKEKNINKKTKNIKFWPLRMPYPPYVQTVTVTNACSAWYANLIRNLLKTVDDYATMENWEHMLKPVRFTVSSFTVSARILWKKNVSTVKRTRKCNVSYEEFREKVSRFWSCLRASLFMM